MPVKLRTYLYYSILKKLTPFKIALIYVFIAFLWFLFFDREFPFFVAGGSGSAGGRAFSILLFIGLSAFVLYSLVRRYADERDAVLEHLSEERNKFEAILAAIGDGISIQSTDYEVMYQNEVHKRFSGRTCVGEYCYRAYGNSDGICTGCPVALSFQDGMIHRAERGVPRGRDRFYVEITASPLRNSSGAVIAGIELVRDVTSRKRAEEKVSEYTRNLERLLGVSREITSTTDLKSLYRKTIAVAKEILRLDYSTIMMLSEDKMRLTIVDTIGFPDSMVDTFVLVAGQGLSTYVTRSKQPGFVVDFRSEQRFEVPPIVKSKGILSAVCVPMMIENDVFGVLIGHTLEQREFSEEEQALYQTIGNNAAVAIKNALHLAALRQSEQRYRTLLENAHDMIQSVDPANGKFLFVNPAWLNTLGYSRRELEQLTIFDVLYERDKDEGSRIFREALAGRSLHHVQVTFAAKDGRPVSTEGTISGHLHNGSAAASYGFFHDVTKRKQIEDQLRHAQKMEAVGQLAGGIAHDFNNILTAILGYASVMLAKTEKDAPWRFTLEQTIAAAKRGAALTRGMLAYSRKQIIDLRPVNLNGVVKNVQSFLVRLIGEEVELRTKLSEKEPAVLADSGQIEQVLMNLATNARDAVGGPGVLLIETDTVELTQDFITVHGFGRTGRYALLCVTDTGTGMDEKTRLKIFEPFFTTKEVGKGTGLGLAIVYGIVKQHNAYINVYSEPGKGTTFKLYFPLIDRAAEAAVEEERPAFTRGSETVLLAEDDEWSRGMLSAVLRQYGYRVIEAADGEEAVEKFRQHRDEVNILVFDVVMPKLNGEKAYDAIIAEHPGVRALFMSGYAADMIHGQGLLREGAGFITKPITPALLLKKVRDILDKRV